jgi:hypothetical protein
MQPPLLDHVPLRRAGPGEPTTAPASERQPSAEGCEIGCGDCVSDMERNDRRPVRQIHGPEGVAGESRALLRCPHRTAGSHPVYAPIVAIVRIAIEAPNDRVSPQWTGCSMCLGCVGIAGVTLSAGDCTRRAQSQRIRLFITESPASPEAAHTPSSSIHSSRMQLARYPNRPSGRPTPSRMTDSRAADAQLPGHSHR